MSGVRKQSVFWARSIPASFMLGRKPVPRTYGKFAASWSARRFMTGIPPVSKDEITTVKWTQLLLSFI